ncbi:uncharacterized protein [Typha angustifolia]|uniref:uncharacterized protein n=1 Tax=Typha angustifolia TaxID=59011 RepID=UPI003C2C8452
MAVTSSPNLDDDDWEICNDEGFIYKRRRRRDPAAEVRPPSPAPGDAEADIRRRQRSRRRRCLLSLRDKYMRELEQWESLSSALLRLTTTTTTSAPADDSSFYPLPKTLMAVAEVRSTQPSIDELLSQVEAQEMVLKKLSEICDYVESVCKEQEESLMESLVELPIWGSPRSLMASLSN